MSDKIPFWKQDGFKRGLGAFLLIAGEVLSHYYPEIGKIVVWLGGLIGGVAFLSPVPGGGPARPAYVPDASHHAAHACRQARAILPVAANAAPRRPVQERGAGELGLHPAAPGHRRRVADVLRGA